MKVSIITVAQADARLLERTTQSVATQDHASIEHIVLDSAPTSERDDGVPRLHERRTSRGFREGERIAALDRGVRHATGDICAWLDPGSVYLPGALSAVVFAFAEDPAIDLMLGDGYRIAASGRVGSRIRCSDFALLPCALGEVTLLREAIFLRRDAFLACGGLNAANSSCWDLELCADFALRGRYLRRLDRCLTMTRLDPQRRNAADMRPLAAKIIGAKPGPLYPLARLLLRLEHFASDPLLRLQDILATPRRHDCASRATIDDQEECSAMIRFCAPAHPNEQRDGAART